MTWRRRIRARSLHIWTLLVLAALARLYRIGSPLIGVHSWRQADTAAMARNYFESGYHLFFPQVDWGGAGPGFVESEFPIVPFLVALLYRILGMHEWIGRAVAALCSLIAGYALFHLVRKTSGERIALWTAAFYLFLPLSLFYSRAFMPDSAMMAASILAVVWFFEWTQTGKPGYWVGSAIAFALACLLKLPCLYLGLPILYMAWNRFGPAFWRLGALWAYALVVIAPVGAWYLHAHQILLHGGLTFGIWEYGSDKWGNWDLVASGRFWNAVLLRSVAERWLTWPGFAVALVGILAVPRTAAERIFDFWLVAILVFFIVVAKGNYVHEYYQWALLPVASFYLAKAFVYGFRSGPNVRAMSFAGILLAMLGLSIWRYSSYIAKENPSSSSQCALATKVRELTERGARVVVVDRGDPTMMYLCDRKGWHASPQEVDERFLSSRAREGAKYVIGVVDRTDDASVAMAHMLADRYRGVLNQEGLIIYALVEPPRGLTRSTLRRDGARE